MRKTFAITALAALVAGTAASAADTTLTISSYGGGYQEAQSKSYFQPFMAQNPGIKIVEDSASSNAKLKAMVETGNVTLDLMLTDDSFGLDTDAQWLEPIDYSIIDKSKFIEGAAGTYRIASDIEATVLAYNAEEFGGAAPNGFADFFDTEKFPGLRAVWKYSASGIFEAALIADGVKPEDLYPIDVERALKKLDTIKDDLVWWESGSQSEQLLASGEANMALVWVSRALSVGEKGVKIDWTNWTSQTGYWVVPKGTKNKEAAMQAINFFTEPTQQIEFTKYMPYGPSNKNALDSVDGKFKGNLPTDHLDTRVLMDAEWWAANGAKVDLRFQEWLLQ
ncbi:putative spermidine/putrescine transport system substrate-binding protein [Mycoplana sp. BE70]|uniref:ABC transporter substrate-binding protein n=1 Tax=Mycoplana sp. BE70 TaxID=2817775 RepID=UPI0028578578|nr:ABC transporter substrate-binding protein [Mycoplana sp. BE70]MDR6756989.1 putative spermidine/putrescine transport system substrate-binding protein [Mycoplana sp. BE70]